MYHLYCLLMYGIYFMNMKTTKVNVLSLQTQIWQKKKYTCASTNPTEPKLPLTLQILSFH
jgi:hypothetical protein